MQSTETKQLELRFQIYQHVTETKKNETSSQLGKLVIATSQNIETELAKPLTREKEILRQIKEVFSYVRNDFQSI